MVDNLNCFIHFVWFIIWKTIYVPVHVLSTSVWFWINTMLSIFWLTLSCSETTISTLNDRRLYVFRRAEWNFADVITMRSYVNGSCFSHRHLYGSISCLNCCAITWPPDGERGMNVWARNRLRLCDSERSRKTHTHKYTPTLGHRLCCRRSMLLLCLLFANDSVPEARQSVHNVHSGSET